MRLIIAEKPSVAQSIAAVLGAKERKDGCLQGNGCLVSWCVGHLVELAQPEAYGDYGKWQYADLPILPTDWQYTVLPNTQKQFAVLKGLMTRQDVTEIVCATDAGREGELIFRLVYQMAGCNKPVQRLWISSMEESAIKAGFAKLRPAAEYDALYRAALCRAQADWLVGINATRLFSVLYRQTLRIGRVMTPTLALIVQREAEIAAFTPVPFYTIILGMTGFAASSERMDNEQEAAEKLHAVLSAENATVTSVERKERSEKPPLLYDLTTLQRDANRLLGYTAQQTLDYTQSLYEKKLCTYPRTDSRYVTEDMADGLPVLVNAIAKTMPFAAHIPIYANVEQVVNGTKVSDHHAILPTMTTRDADLAALPAGERAILHLICARLLCAVGQKHDYAETVITVSCAGTDFTAKGRAVLNPGWRALDAAYRATLKSKPEAESEAKPLPLVAEGDKMEVVTAAAKEGKTTPPKHFTEDTLLSAMESAGSEDMPEDVERKGLGTPATRAGILEKLVQTGYVERKKAKAIVNLLPTHKAVSLITVLPEQIQSPRLTAEWEARLKEIERGMLAPEDFMAEIGGMACELVQTYEAVQDGDVLFAEPHEAIGVCPRCGGSVVETQKAFSCETTDCGFALWKNSRFFTAKKKQLTKAIVAALLKEGSVLLRGCYSEKSGKTYDVTVALDDTGKYVNYKMLFGGKDHVRKHG